MQNTEYLAKCGRINAFFVSLQNQTDNEMSKYKMPMAVLMLMMLVAAGCHKPDEPNNGGNNGDNGNNDTIEKHEYVDLGLPSGTFWATCNVGADTPEGYGDYFAWGETSAKGIYAWKNYRYGRLYNERYELNTYCTDSCYGLDGFVDDLVFLEPNDDVVQAQWGTDWRMPTKGEWEELLLNTVSFRTTFNDVEGWIFTASNGNSLFLPATGYYWNDSFNAGLGIYWSSMINKEFPYRAWGIHFNWDQCHICGSSDRCRGQSVRAVRAEK